MKEEKERGRKRSKGEKSGIYQKLTRRPIADDWMKIYRDAVRRGNNNQMGTQCTKNNTKGSK